MKVPMLKRGPESYMKRAWIITKSPGVIAPVVTAFAAINKFTERPIEKIMF
jgi:hypothetical protein